MSTSEAPTADQLAASRLSLWHQNGPLAGSLPDAQNDLTPAASAALLTVEALREWLTTAGLVLFAPRSQHLPAPAPSLVEATLGSPSPSPSLADTETARTLLAHLIADGSAIPLSLLGTPTGAAGSNFGPDIPDFVVSSAVFPYIFTLRGDKTWKQPPSTSGASKVSPLSLNAYTLLLEHGTLSAYDLATQLGKEVTEAAVLRSLVELWSHLRVIPIPQTDGRPTLWEPTTTRLTKQIKAGANAGQPTALSALISLYLGQSILATEDEIETFLSPLAPRSRIRDVIHALLGARELDTLAIDGRTVLHVAGALPSFLGHSSEPEVADPRQEAGASSGSSTLEQQLGPAGEPLRIKKFIARPRKIGTGFVTRPVRKPFGAPDRERRPFSRDADPRPERPAPPAFNKPWDKDKPARRPTPPGVESAVGGMTAGSSSSADEAGPGRSPSRKPSFGDRKPSSRRVGEGDRPSLGGGRPAYGSKPAFGGKPRFGQNSRAASESAGGDRAGRSFAPRPGGFSARSGFSAARSDRPAPYNRKAGDARPPSRDLPTRRPRDGDSAQAPTPGSSSRPTFDRKPGSYAGKPPSRERPSFDRKPGSYSALPDRPAYRENAGNTRPARRDAGAPAGRDTPRSRPAPGTFDRLRKPFTGREEGDRPARPAFRKFDAPRGPRPTRPAEGGAPSRDASSRSAGGFERKPGSYNAKSGGGGARPGGPAGRSGDFPPRKPFAGNPGGSSAKPAGDKPFRKPGRFAGDAPGANTFDKFKGGKKPFGKRPPARKFKPDQGPPPSE